MEYQESGADTANSLADPNGFRYGAGASEGELTLPRASIAAFEVPQPANWHVHLELRPEELVALHRLGLTRGAIAWREGMEAWQPLRESQEPIGLGSEILGRAAMQSSSDLEPTVASAPSSSSSPSDWSDAVTVASDRGSDPANHLVPATDGDGDSVILLSPRVRRATLPPTSPLFAAAARPHVAAVATPSRSRTGGGAGSSYPPPSAAFGDSAVPLPFGAPSSGAQAFPPAPRMPSFASPDPAQFGAFPASTAPLSFEPTGVTPAFRRSNLWLGALGLAGASMLFGAVVSGIFSEPKGEPPQAAAAATTTTNTVDAAATVTTPSTGLAPVPVEKLPVAGAAAKVAASPEPAAPAAEERVPDRDAPNRAAREVVSRAAAAPRSEPRSAPEPKEEPAPERKPSSLDEAMAQAAGATPRAAPEPARDESESEPAAEPKSASGGPDLKEISKAVSSAARAASSCGASPQSGRVAITFSPSGAVRSVQMEQQYDERDVGSCVLRAMGRVKVSAFSGDPVTVRKSVSW